MVNLDQKRRLPFRRGLIRIGRHDRNHGTSIQSDIQSYVHHKYKHTV
jgi:hypothetical protein